jgi:uncharacterized protein YlxP (DUF503 family)
MTLVVGVCRVWLRLPENHSLRGKRQVVRPLIERVRKRFDVAVAEVDNLDSWQIASIGFSCISTDAQHADEMMTNIVAFIEDQRLDVELLDYRTETLYVLTEDIRM